MRYHLRNPGWHSHAQLVFTVVIGPEPSSDSFHFTAVPYPIHPIRVAYGISPQSQAGFHTWFGWKLLQCQWTDRDVQQTFLKLAFEPGASRLQSERSTVDLSARKDIHYVQLTSPKG